MMRDRNSERNPMILDTHELAALEELSLSETLDRAEDDRIARVEEDATDYGDELPRPSDEDLRFAAEAFRLPDDEPAGYRVSDFMIQPAWESTVISVLVGLHYTTTAICRILGHAREWGSVEGLDSMWLLDADRAAVEALLPDAHDGEWDRYPGRYEATTPAGYEV
jgi:hypothetical protein